MVCVMLPDSDEPICQVKKCLDITEEIGEECLKQTEVTIDLSKLSWILPCSALILSSKINEVAKKGCKIKFIKPEKQQVQKYLESVGFPLGSERVGETYVPLHHFSKGEGEDSTCIIEKEMENIYNVVQTNLPSGLINGIYYLLGELSDNIDQHSDFTQASVMVQYYRGKGHIDIGILDNGKTIPGVFEENGLEFDKDKDALKMALRGISTREGEIGRGKGLRTSKQLVQSGLKGEFLILSRNGLVKTVGDKTTFEEIGGKSLKGTLVYMRFLDPRKSLNIYKYVE